MQQAQLHSLGGKRIITPKGPLRDGACRGPRPRPRPARQPPPGPDGTSGRDPNEPEAPPRVLGRQLGALLRRWGGGGGPNQKASNFPRSEWEGPKLEGAEYPALNPQAALGRVV